MFSSLTREDRQYLFSWSLLTGAGSMAGLMLMNFIASALDVPATAEQGDTISTAILAASLLLYFIPGLTIGLGQWFELRTKMARAGWWILATAGGWIVGFILFNLTGAIFGGLPGLLLLVLFFLFLGGLSGAAQYLLLRRQWDNVTLWIPVSAGAAVVGGFGWIVYGVIGGSISWTIAGAITGYTMLKLRDRSIMS